MQDHRNCSILQTFGKILKTSMLQGVAVNGQWTNHAWFAREKPWRIEKFLAHKIIPQFLVCKDHWDEFWSLHARKFCRPTSGVNVATWLRLNVCWCTSEACKYKKSNHNYGHDDSLLNCNIGWKKHTADLALTNIASRSSQTLSQESFTRKWWLSFKPETQKFTKKAFSFQGKQTFYLPA